MFKYTGWEVAPSSGIFSYWALHTLPLRYIFQMNIELAN